MGKPKERFVVKQKTKNSANLEKTIKQIRKRGISYREWQLEKYIQYYTVSPHFILYGALSNADVNKIYVCTSKGENGLYNINEFTIFGFIVTENRSYITINRYQKYGKLNIGSSTFTKNEILNYYTPLKEIIETNSKRGDNQ